MGWEKNSANQMIYSDENAPENYLSSVYDVISYVTVLNFGFSPERKKRRPTVWGKDQIDWSADCWGSL